MRQLGMIIGALVGLALHASAQDTTKISTGDTVKVGGITIINRDDNSDHGGDIVWDSTGKARHYRFHSHGKVSTDWFLIDLGFDNYTDNTNYSSAATQALSPGATADRFALRNGKSINFNLWFFMTKVNLIHGVLNLKYGLGIETHNYRYTNNIIYHQNPLQIVPDTINYRKNKLATDFLTLPVMINFTFNPGHPNPIGLSVGMSAGYLYSGRQKVISDEHGKQKTHSSFNLEQWRLSYIAELNLGPIGIYGEMATKSMYKYGLDMTPYSIGLRLDY
jgi:ribosomal silencing factor RsfS